MVPGVDWAALPAELGDPAETGDTFVANAVQKARFAFDATGLWSLADDSGLEVDALGGRPGVHSKRFSPEGRDDTNNALLLHTLAAVPASERRARFRCVIALVGPAGAFTASGACEGAIGFAPRGEAGFGYDPLFLPAATPGRTMAELTPSEKDRISHRGSALARLPELLWAAGLRVCAPPPYPLLNPLLGAPMVVIITGASTGIGAALALEYGRRGHKVGLVARRADLLAEVAEQVRAAGGTAAFAAADVTRRSDLTEAIGQIEASLGPCDLLVANAGSGEPTPAHKSPIDTIERILDLNVKGVLFAIGAVLPGMVERKSGHIAAVSSVAGFRGLPGSGGYSASKAYVTTLLESFRVDLKRRGVAVTSINPGFIATPLTAPNRFKMPFLMGADRAARIIADGLDHRPAELTFPFPMKVLMNLARLVPNWLYDLVIKSASPMKG